MIPFNPCGRVVDFIRKPYTTYARFHQSEEAPLVKIRWYFTDVEECIEETCINSLFLDHEPWAARLVGEQPFEPVTTYRPTTIDGLTGEHVCGTAEDHARGAAWPYTGPVVEYDEDNIPLCCPRGPGAHVGVACGPKADVEMVVVPGSVCSDAPQLLEDVWYEFPVVSGGQYFRQNPIAGETQFNIEFEPEFPLVSWQLIAWTWEPGTSCDTMVNILFTGTETGFYDNIPLTPPVGHVVIWGLFAGFPVGGTYTVRWRRGPH